MLTSSEKEICQKKLKVQYELLEKMLENYCNLIQLQSVLYCHEGFCEINNIVSSKNRFAS